MDAKHWLYCLRIILTLVLSLQNRYIRRVNKGHGDVNGLQAFVREWRRVDMRRDVQVWTWLCWPTRRHPERRMAIRARQKRHHNHLYEHLRIAKREFEGGCDITRASACVLWEPCNRVDSLRSTVAAIELVQLKSDGVAWLWCSFWYLPAYPE